MRKRYIAFAVVIALGAVLSLFTFLYWNNQESDESKLLPEKTGYVLQSGVRYLNDSNPYHLMDVYLPIGDGPFPAMIYLHGGGWVEGNRSEFGATAAFYAKRGIAGFTIDYTLATQNNSAWPTNIDDALAAVRYIKNNAQNFSVDPSRIASVGNSAGAQLASLLGTLSGDESFLANSTTEHVNSQVQLVINYASVADLEFVGKNRTENNNLIYSIVSSLFGNVSYEQNPNLWKEASPATYISADDATFVFVHGIYDRIVPIEIAESFNTKLQNVGVETYFVKIDGDHHILTNEWWNLQARYTIEPVLRRVFDLN